MLYISSSYVRLSYKTLKVYLAGIQYHSIINGFPVSLSSMHQLFYTLRGVRRLQGSAFTRPPRSPITTRHLHILLEFFRSSFKPFDANMLSAAALTAFFGLLRSSEYLPAHSSTYDPATTLLCSDVFISPDLSFASIHLKCSKTDPFRVGCLVKLWSTKNSLCPVTALHRHMLRHSQGPVFTFQNGSYLNRQIWSSIIQMGLRDITLNTHSFRIGGASSAHAVGVPDSTIQTLGRWSSSAYQVYLRLPDDTVRRSQCLMSQSSFVLRWDPHP